MDAPAPHGAPKPDLFSKVGPLPAWAWGALALVAFFAFQHFHGGGTPQAVDNPVEGQGLDPNTTANADSGIPTVDPSQAGYNYGDVLGGNYGGTTSGTVYSTNQQWGVAAIQGLIRMGVPASLATTSVTLYLSGTALTADEATTIGQAIAAFGPPPLPLPVTQSAPVATAPAPSPTPKPAPAPTPKPAPVPAPKPTPAPIAKPKTYTIRSGDTLTAIALRHRTTAGALYTKNASLLDSVARKHGRKDSGHGRYIYPGTVIRL